MLTPDQLLLLAPDPATARRGTELANSKKWTALGRSDNALWGECPGSGSVPYRTGIHLEGPAFKCSCPVQAQPCKHALGLYLLFASVPEIFASRPAPDWMANWLGNRSARQEPAVPPPAPEAPVDPALLAQKNAERKKRSGERLALMASGVRELERWLGDLMREGLASTADPTFWDRTYRSMIDAKLPGPANTVREMAQLVAQGDWQGAFLLAGDLYLLVRAFQQLDTLEPSLQDELLNQLGVVRKKSEVLEEPAVPDEWQVLGIVEGTTPDNISFRRTWLHGLETGRDALLYDFAFGGVHEAHYRTGTAFRAELAYYPGAFALRAAVKQPPEGIRPAEQLPRPLEVRAFLADYARAIGQNPWLTVFPARLGNVVPLQVKGNWFVVDHERSMLPFRTSEGVPWKLMARSAGHPIDVFGEWNGRELLLV
jgi:hypothetical protein